MTGSSIGRGTTIGGVLAALVATAAFGGCGVVGTGAGRAADRTVDRAAGDPGGGDRDVRTLSAAEVEANAKVRLPPGTVLLSTSFASALDWHLTAMFRIPGDELPGFLDDSRFPAPEPGLRAVRTADHPGGDTWRPDDAVSVSGIDQRDEPVDGVFRTVLLDLDAPDEVTVYLVAFTT
ncbi:MULTISPECIES: hypothetical protein [unclassified Solwaraspora]|uniref:hypothetical protein n=1 Tax=unclassified Solwaraspora TaxID=2627926 RepID=UPI00259B6547|nr:hypothetical protein [Solwaraspora sp. WMMA2056]WJK40153.1 hypothetical protein O7608_27660 [Solwaraspora sp. WMMA2056]